MRPSQFLSRFLPARVAFMLLIPAWLAVVPNAGNAQQRIVSPEGTQQSRRLNLQFSGEQPRPLSMVSGDFDEDGFQDLVIGYATEGGGSIYLLRGNPDVITPRTETAWLAAGKHEYSDPFIQRWKPISTPVQPDLLISADVNGDGHLDLVYATKGSSHLTVMFGTGKGTFLPQTASITLPGAISALSAYRPGAPVLGQVVIVGYQSGTSGGLAIVSNGATGLKMNAKYALSAAPSVFSVANLDSDLVPDTAIAAGGELFVLHGANAINGRGKLEVLPVNNAQTVAAGDFLFDRHGLPQLAVLTSSGEIIYLAHEGFDPQPYTAQEIAAARRDASQHGSHTPTLAQQAGDNGSAPWVEVERKTNLALRGSGSDVPVMLRSRMSGSGGDDLVLLNASQQQRIVISHTNPTLAKVASSRISFSSISSGNAIAALSMRVSADGRPGLVILNDSNPSPEITDPAAGRTFYVNTTADNTGTTTDQDDGVRCTQGSSERCTLRDAITFVNDDATDNINAGKSDTIMLPAGTYPLTWQAGTFDANANAVTHLEVAGPVTIMGSGSPVIDAQQNDTVFTINPGSVGSFNTTSLVFDMTIENLTIQNGKNKNNPVDSNTGLFNNVGGAINWDAFGTGNLTLSNVTVQNNSIIWGAGGGVWGFNSAGSGNGTLTITGSTISNNSTSEQGGGIYIAFAPVGLTVTNTTISGNKASVTVNPSDPGGADGDDAGGGIFLTARPSGSSIPQTSLSGLTITSNTANGDGGGINTGTGLVLSTSLLSGNTSTFATPNGQTNNGDAFNGGGFWSEIALPEVAPTITSTNFLQNSAYTSGGAIAMGSETEAAGNILQISLSRIFGNTSTNGVSGLANGQENGTGGTGEAIASNNWWGCNNGPTTSGDGCDQAAKYPTGTSSGTLTVAPYAQFLLSATPPTTINLGSSIGLNLTLNTNSSSQPIAGAFPAVSSPNYTYSFAVSGVTADSIPSGTFSTTGTGTATLTPTSTGSGMVSAKFDNQTDSVNFTVTAIATSIAAAINPGTTYPYGQPPSISITLNPTSATGITASDFTVKVDGSSSGYSVSLISGTEYQVDGPFNALTPGSHALNISFVGTTDYASSNFATTLTVNVGAVTISDTVTPTNPIQGQGGTVNVTVAGVGSGVTPTGTITYAFDGGATSTVSLSSGAAAITIPTIISTGSHTLSLGYGGDTNYLSNSTSALFTVFGRSQTTIAAITTTTATVDVFGFGFTPPSGYATLLSAGPQPNVPLNTSTATTSLLPQVTTSTGAGTTYPVWTTLADVNGDGILDLITSLYQTDTIAVQLGNGNGTFGAATRIQLATGFGPAENHTAILRTGSNKPVDIIVGSFNTNQIAVLLGNGNGTFGSPTFYTVGSSANTPTSLTTGDFNHDGFLDIAVANLSDNTIKLLNGNGTGGLTIPDSSISAGGIAPEAVRAADFNGDGYSDLVVANYSSGAVTILLNTTNNEVFSPTTISVGTGTHSGPQALAITGSGSNQLIAVANSGSNNVSILKNNGSGTFTLQTTVSVGKGPDDVNFADFNGDGIEDLVVSNYTDGTVDLLLGNLSGGYALVGPFKVGNGPYSAAVGDLDLDGTPDIVVSNCFSNNTGVLISGTQISVPFTGLDLIPGASVAASYQPDAGSKYGSSMSAVGTVP